jgi:hypothetical protein
VLITEGELLRQPAREKRWEPLEGGEKVYPGDTLRTGDGPGAILFFTDGSYSELKAKTTLRLARTTESQRQRPERLDLERGTVVCVVRKGGPRFVVETPSGAKAVVHGTTFSVTVGAKRETLLLVEEGVVALKSQGKQVLVREGMQSHALAGQAPRRPVRLTAPLAPPPPELSAETSPEGTLRVAPPIRRPDAAAGSQGAAAPGGLPDPPPTGTSVPADSSAEPARLPATSSGYTPEDRVQVPFSTSR